MLAHRASEETRFSLHQGPFGWVVVDIGARPQEFDISSTSTGWAEMGNAGPNHPVERHNKHNNCAGSGEENALW